MRAWPARISLGVGEAVVLRGSWDAFIRGKALGPDERRILTAIGFRRDAS